MTKKQSTPGTVKVRQTGSSIRRHGKQAEHLKALGLGKINAIRELPDTPETRGLIQKARHMVKIVSEWVK